MVSKHHCPVCGFLMIMELKEGDVSYRCINSEHLIGEPKGVHVSDNMLEAYKALGTNVDILMEYLKRP